MLSTAWAWACASRVYPLVDRLAKLQCSHPGISERHPGMVADDDAYPLVAPGKSEEPGPRIRLRVALAIELLATDAQLQARGRWVGMIASEQCSQGLAVSLEAPCRARNFGFVAKVWPIYLNHGERQ